MNQAINPAKPFDHWSATAPKDAEAALLACCGSRRWAGSLTAMRPFLTPTHLLDEARTLWFSLDEPDWLEAFACHPRIGERQPQARASVDFAAHSDLEQSTAQQTLDQVAEALAAGNRAYEQRFGFLYLVFASGRTAPELLAVLNERLTHDRTTELREAAIQQQRITELRMNRWLQP